MILFGSFGSTSAQVAVPYRNSFDNINDTIGWSHFAINGTDDWAIGTPTKYYLRSPFSLPNVWITDLNNGYAGYSERVLETPSFNLSNTSIRYALSFFHQRQSSSSGAYYYLEYSTNGGSTWQLLDNATAPKKNWQLASGFQGNFYGSFQHSSINLSFIQGLPDVKFRFRYVTNYPNGDGWMIDNFGIEKEYFNISAQQGDSIFVSQNCGQFNVTSNLNFYNQYSNSINNTTRYYFSRDVVLDASDNLIATKSSFIQESVNGWTQTINMLPNLNVGNYYIIYQHDALNVLTENNENDNTGYAVLKIDSVFSTPFIDDFENSIEPWKAYLETTGSFLVWESGKGYRHHLEGTHSGNKAWHTSKSIEFNHWNCGNGCNAQYVESNFINLTGTPGNAVLSLWYKANFDVNTCTIEYSSDCRNSWNTLYTFLPNSDDEWDFINVPLNTLTSFNNVKFRIKYTASYLAPEGIIFDDIYIGTAKSDLSIENDKSNRFTSGSVNSATLKYYLNNSGLAAAPQTSTKFYWSTDSLLDASDILLGTKTEQTMGNAEKVWTNFTYTKPTNATGKYYIIYVLDAGSILDEMREYDNKGYFTLYQQNLASVPYSNDFNTQINGWRHNASLGADDWQWSVAHGTLLDSASTGTKGWITKDTGLVSPMSRMHLYSPVFDLSTLTQPVLEFDMKLHSHPSCNCFEGKTNMSYSTDGGATWIILDTTNSSYNRWYYPMDYSTGNGNDYNYDPNYTEILFANSEKAFAAYTQYNSRDAKRNTRYVLDVSFLAGTPQIQFRYNLATLINNSQSPNYPVEGAFVDNFNISQSFVDLNVDYKRALMISSKAQKIKLYMQIKNQGNYISIPGNTNFYVSADTVLDATDVLLGQVNIPSIRPDMYYYLNNDFNAPSNLSNFKYLLYELDGSGTNNESNEINNKSFWPLSLDSIRSYPYFNNFNDTIVDGWHHYSMNWSNTTKANYRIRNMVAPGEPLYQTDVESGQLFTERVASGSWNNPPYFFLETPAFDFTRMDSIFMSFDLMCTGVTQTDGGNMSFSTDGGNTYNVLTTSYGQSYNWYNNASLSNLNNEPGWAIQAPAYAVSRLDSTTFNLSFLRGKKDVVFRYKYKSNHETWGGGTVQGLRIDNFKIGGSESQIDYVANDSMAAINGTASQPSININYAITNAGLRNGRPTNTKFYWSTDSILNAGDILIHSVVENPILTGSTLSGTTTVNNPGPVSQAVYYLFYVADGDSNIVETNELNNVGSFKINFPPSSNYYANAAWTPINVQTSQPAFNVTYSIINNSLLDGVATTTSFYWSADSILDAGDQNIPMVNELPVLSGDTLTATTSITYPMPLTQSKYFLFYKADSGNNLPESNENDNAGSYIIEFYSQPNYYADYAGDTIHTFTTQPAFNVEYSIINNGDSAGINSTTAFYWSADNVLDPGDQIIRTVDQSPISQGDTLRQTISITYPTPIIQGAYYLFYKADNNNTNAEINENDNTGFYVIHFQTQPNYYANVSGNTIHATATQTVINVVYSIINNGAANGSNSSTDFYWSADSTLDSGDQIVYSSNEPPILSGDTLVSSATITYPIPTTSPTYFLFYKSDSRNGITETNENDNTGVYKINFTPNGADSSGLVNMYVSGDRLYIVTPANFIRSVHVLKMLDMSGNIYVNQRADVSPGTNSFLLPYTSGGIYMLLLYNRNGELIKRIFIRR